ncbi:MAG: hypothetical protein IIU73_07520, partial [Selenomonadales bacterium]|nr:hypothetical protein [Selenomonadales bacterium]
GALGGLIGRWHGFGSRWEGLDDSRLGLCWGGLGGGLLGSRWGGLDGDRLGLLGLWGSLGDGLLGQFGRLFFRWRVRGGSFLRRHGRHIAFEKECFGRGSMRRW